VGQLRPWGQSFHHSLFVGWDVSVGGRCDHVVEEGQVSGDVLGGPVGEEGVEEALESILRNRLGRNCRIKSQIEFKLVIMTFNRWLKPT
jgi:hypothetical protein